MFSKILHWLVSEFTHQPNWRFILLWSGRFISVLYSPVAILIAVVRFREAQDYASFLQAAGLFFTAVIALFSWLVRSEKKPHVYHSSKREYAHRLISRFFDFKTKHGYVDLEMQQMSDRFRYAVFEDYFEGRYLRDRPFIVGTLDDVITTFSTRGQIPKFVLLGDTGAGKTVTLLHKAMELAQLYCSEETANRLPFLVDLGDDNNSTDADELLQRWWYEIEGIAVNFERECRAGRVWLLLDGLNEMPNQLLGKGSWKARSESLSKPRVQVFVERKRENRVGSRLLRPNAYKGTPQWILTRFW